MVLTLGWDIQYEWFYKQLPTESHEFISSKQHWMNIWLTHSLKSKSLSLNPTWEGFLCSIEWMMLCTRTFMCGFLLRAHAETHLQALVYAADIAALVGETRLFVSQTSGWMRIFWMIINDKPACSPWQPFLPSFTCSMLFIWIVNSEPCGWMERERRGKVSLPCVCSISGEIDKNRTALTRLRFTS